MTAAPHVGIEMQALAISPVSAEPPPDPIAVLVREGHHREALTACARTYGPILGRLCMALLGSQADADEATQETLLRAHRAMATYRAEGTVKAWLCGMHAAI
jgi:RNA polymerase sigma-70 factor (ECF subfamily)